MEINIHCVNTIFSSYSFLLFLVAFFPLIRWLLSNAGCILVVSAFVSILWVLFRALCSKLYAARSSNGHDAISFVMVMCKVFIHYYLLVNFFFYSFDSFSLFAYHFSHQRQQQQKRGRRRFIRTKRIFRVWNSSEKCDILCLCGVAVDINI